ncbi:unnamed protein product, partial [Lymnaea stagnalis]
MVFCSIGLPTNVLTIVTVLKMQTLSPATFLTALLAFSDAGALVSQIIAIHVLRHYKPWAVFSYIILFPYIYFTALSNWLLVLICLERYVSICHPLKRQYLFTKKRSYVGAAILSFVIFVLLLIFYVTLHNVRPDNSFVDWFDKLLVIIIPFAIIITLTAAIIRGIRKSRIERRRFLRRSRQEGRQPRDDPMSGTHMMIKLRAKSDRTITHMLLFDALVFLFLFTPLLVFTEGYKHGFFLQSKHFYILLGTIATIMLDFSHVLNFFIYFIAAKKFR